MCYAKYIRQYSINKIFGLADFCRKAWKMCGPNYQNGKRPKNRPDARIIRTCFLSKIYIFGSRKWRKSERWAGDALKKLLSATFMANFHLRWFAKQGRNKDSDTGGTVNYSRHVCEFILFISIHIHHSSYVKKHAIKMLKLVKKEFNIRMGYALSN